MVVPENDGWMGVSVIIDGISRELERLTRCCSSAHMKFFWVSYGVVLIVLKIQIFYKTGRVRVIISTANMVDYDWDWIENVGAPL